MGGEDVTLPFAQLVSMWQHFLGRLECEPAELSIWVDANAVAWIFVERLGVGYVPTFNVQGEIKR